MEDSTDLQLADNSTSSTNLAPSPFDFPIVAPTKKRSKTISKKCNDSQFHRYFIPTNDPSMLQCILCPPNPPCLKRYLYNGKKVTSLLRGHLSYHHKPEYDALVEGDSRYVQARKHLLRAVATGALPFSLSNNVELRKFSHCLDPHFVLPDSYTLSTTILDSEYSEAYNSVKTAVSSQDVSLCFDHWTSKDSSHSLMGAIAHYIDDQWTRQLYIISLDSIDGRHDGNQVIFLILRSSYHPFFFRSETIS